MTLKQTINADFTTAFKSGNRAKKDCLAMVKTEIMKIEKSEENAGKELTDAQVLEIISKYNKQLQQTIDQVKDETNPLVISAKAEQSFISVYLPTMMTTEEITAEVELILCGGIDFSNKGKVIGTVMSAFKANFNGRYNPNELKQIVDKVLININK